LSGMDCSLTSTPVSVHLKKWNDFRFTLGQQEI